MLVVFIFIFIVFFFFFLMIRRPPRSTRTTHSFPTRRSSDLPSYFATSMYRNNSLESNLESYGIFGEVYFDLSDRLTLTGGLRYNNDKKDVTARTTLISFLNPYANDGDPFDTPIMTITGPYGLFDADPGTSGQQLDQVRAVSCDERSEEHTSELRTLK